MQTFRLNDFVARQGIDTNNPILGTVGLLRPLIGDSAWIAGGAVTALIKGYRTVKDYDMYFSSQEHADFFAENILAAGGRETFRSENALTFNLNERTIQLITRRFYQNAQEIFDDFDLTISMFAVDFDGNLYADDYSLFDLANKEIRIKHVNHLASTFKRLIKYGKKGYHIPKCTYEKLMMLFAVNGEMQITDEAGVADDTLINIQGTGYDWMRYDEFGVPQVRTEYIPPTDVGGAIEPFNHPVNNVVRETIMQIQEHGANYDDGTAIIQITT